MPVVVLRGKKRKWKGHYYGEGLIVRYGPKGLQYAVLSHAHHDGRRLWVAKWSVHGQRFRGVRIIDPDIIVKWMGRLKIGKDGAANFA